jgi:hypothetical protein
MMRVLFLFGVNQEAFILKVVRKKKSFEAEESLGSGMEKERRGFRYASSGKKTKELCGKEEN